MGVAAVAGIVAARLGLRTDVRSDRIAQRIRVDQFTRPWPGHPHRLRFQRTPALDLLLVDVRGGRVIV